MSASLLAPASLAGYAMSEVLYGWYLYQRKARLGQAATACLLVSLAVHYFALVERSRALHTVPYNDLWGSMSLLAWLLGVVYLVVEFRYRDRVVGAFLLPFVLMLQAVTLFFGRAPLASLGGELKGSLFALHITSNISAYAAFGLAFILSSLFLVEQHFIRSHQWGRLFWRLPPLGLLERMSRTAVEVGLVALSVGLVTGFMAMRRYLGTSWSGDPKELWSLLVLVVYVLYLLLQSRAGWQGSRASLFCVLAFGILIFGYTVVNLFWTRYHIFY